MNASASEVAAQAAAEGKLDDNLAQLDLHLTYLWRVHGVDYYGGREVWDAVLAVCCSCFASHAGLSRAGRLVRPSTTCLRRLGSAMGFAWSVVRHHVGGATAVDVPGSSSTPAGSCCAPCPIQAEHGAWGTGVQPGKAQPAATRAQDAALRPARGGGAEFPCRRCLGFRAWGLRVTQYTNGCGSVTSVQVMGSPACRPCPHAVLLQPSGAAGGSACGCQNKNIHVQQLYTSWALGSHGAQQDAEAACSLGLLRQHACSQCVGASCPGWLLCSCSWASRQECSRVSGSAQHCQRFSKSSGSCSVSCSCK